MLISLDLSHNHIVTLSSTFCSFPMVQYLDLGYNKLTSCMEIGTIFPKVTNLSLRYNKIQTLHGLSSLEFVEVIKYINEYSKLKPLMFVFRIVVVHGFIMEFY